MCSHVYDIARSCLTVKATLFSLKLLVLFIYLLKNDTVLKLGAGKNHLIEIVLLMFEKRRKTYTLN